MPLRDHMPQLDVLRAFAVLAVVWSHWGPASWQGGLPWGLIGVQIFFVLSGFLITGILLDAKEGVESPGGGLTRGQVMRHFYMRRALRLVPAYYVVLTLALVANVGTLRSCYPWHFAYLSNWFFIRHGGWDRALSPFWTLAVEEQFYLCWPLVVLWVGRRALPRVFLIVLLAGVSYRVAGAWFMADVPLYWVATPGQVHALALGALLAWWTRQPPRWWQTYRAYRIPLATGLLAAAALAHFCVPGEFGTLGRELALAGVFGIMIQAAPEVRDGAMGWLLHQPVLRHIGKISYGIYLWHDFSARPAAWLADRLPLGLQSPWALFAARAAFTLGVVWLSWYGLEQPAMRLKRRFAYDKPRGVTPAITEAQSA